MNHKDKFGNTRWIDSAGYFHRVDGPAIIWSNGAKEWYEHGVRHRLDGPAFEYLDHDKQWFINGYFVDAIINKWAEEYDIDLNNLSEEDKFMIRLHWENFKQ